MAFKEISSLVKKGFVGEADPNFDNLADEATKRAVQAAKTAQEKGLTGEDAETNLSGKIEIRAKFKIEVFFGPDRTIAGPNLCQLSVWESGKRFHGGGDELAFFCQDVEGPEGCGHIITSNCIQGAIAVCPGCQRAVLATRLTTGRIGRVSTRRLAQDIETLFHQLGSNSDLYCKYDRTDIRYKAMLADKGPEKARRLRGLHIYPLKNILKDTAYGADLVKRIHAFLTA